MKARLLPLVRTAVAFGVAATLAVILAQDPARGAFSAVSGSSANSVGTAASFCASPGSGSAALGGDTHLDQAAANANYSTASEMPVTSQSGAAQRVLLRFGLPTLGTGCSITAATLRLYNATPTPGRVVEAYRIDPADAWSVSAVTWNTRPSRVGTPATSTVGTVAAWQEWDATALAQDLYALGNNGLLLRDQAEGSSSAKTQKFDAEERAGTDHAQLLLTWG